MVACIRSGSSSRQDARELLASLKGRSEVEGAESNTLQGLRLAPEVVTWSTAQEGQKTQHARGFLASGDWMYEIDSEGQGAPERLRELCETFAIERDDPRYIEAEVWYARRLDWTAPLRHNIFFSILSSLCFALLLFALAAWKLKRIDF